jgi:hypothetical protein
MAAAALLAAGCGTSASHAGASQAAAPQTAAPQASSAAPAPALSARDQKYVNDVRNALAALNLSTTSTDAAIANVGHGECANLRDGSHHSPSSNGRASKAIMQVALRDLCPGARPHVLIRFSGSGILNSAPFRVTTSTVKVRFTYNCASQGTGNFIADMETGNQASLGSDDQSIANALGSGGTQHTTLYPTNVGSMYHIEVNSECSWSLVVKSG